MMDRANKKELAVGIVFLLIGVVYFALAFTIPAYDAYGGSSVVDSSFVPKVVGVLLMLLSAVQIYLTGKKGRQPAAPKEQPAAQEGESEEFRVEDYDDDALSKNADTKSLLAIFAILILYMALMSVLGFMISTALFLMASMLLLTPAEKRRLPFMIVLSLVVSVGVYYLFVNGLDLVLPAGILG